MKKSFFSLFILVCSLLATNRVNAEFNALTNDDLDVLKQIRSAVFGGNRINSAQLGATIIGKEPPDVGYKEPPTFAYNAADRAIIVWKIKKSKAEDFAAAIKLPSWMKLAKVSSITETFLSKNNRKKYYMLVDIANTERYVQGTKVEWKTFVTVGDDPIPKLFRFDSQNALAGVDLLDMTAQPFCPDPTSDECTIKWGIEGNLASGVVANSEGALEISIPLRYKWNWRNWRNRERELRTSWSRAFTEEFLTASEDVYGPNGSHSRYYYDGSLVSAKIISTNDRDIAIDNTFRWAKYAGKLESVVLPLKKTKHLVQPIGIPVGPEGAEFEWFTNAVTTTMADLMSLAETGDYHEIPDLIKEKMGEQIGYIFYPQNGFSPEKLPSLFYGLLDFYQSVQISAGAELPKMFFALKETPMTVWINFEIRDEQVADFKDAFLPKDFKLAKIRFYPEQRRGVYVLSLNVYGSDGQGGVTGNRAEWSTYVINPNEENPKARFSVLKAKTTAEYGFDPVTALKQYKEHDFTPATLNGVDEDGERNIFKLMEAPIAKFDYSLTEETGLSIEIDNEDNVNNDAKVYVEVSIAYPDEKDILYTRPRIPWMEANDFVYWGEVADHVKYDSNLMFADLIVFDAASSDIIIENSEFTEYIESEPLPIIFWDGIQNIALEPWGNLEDIKPAD